MLLADHQEVIGERAFQCVEGLNRTTVSKFQSLNGFRDSLNQNKQLKSFYGGLSKKAKSRKEESTRNEDN